MNIPKVIFNRMPLEDNIDMVIEGYFNNDININFKKYIYKLFPELKYIDQKQDKNQTIIIIRDVVKKYYYKNIKIIDNEIKRYSELWSNYNDKYMKALSSYLNIDWNINQINARVGLIPFFPRYLETFSFDICPNLSNEMIMKIIAHETLHFIWFHKWLELFPDTKRGEMDSPYNVWEYSEMVTDCIINSNDISLLYKFNEKSYDYFYEIKDGDNLVMDKLNDIFKGDDSIENKIINGYLYVLNFIGN